MSRRVTGWRKLAGSTWNAPSDPQFFGDLDLDAATLVDYIAKARAATGVHVTVTHLVGKAVARGLATIPELRVRLARGREHERESVDVFFIVASGGGHELTGVKVQQADQKPVVEIGSEVTRRLAAIQPGEDPEFGRGKALLTRLPPRLLRYTLRVAAWLTSDLNLDLSRIGMPRQAFGGAMITSVGMWGITRAYSPLARYYRVPVLVLVGAVRQQPVVVAGEVLARPTLTLTATFDHRYADGYQAAQLAQVIKEYCADPAAFEPPLAPVPAPATGGSPPDGPRAADSAGAGNPVRAPHPGSRAGHPGRRPGPAPG